MLHFSYPLSILSMISTRISFPFFSFHPASDSAGFLFFNPTVPYNLPSPTCQFQKLNLSFSVRNRGRKARIFASLDGDNLDKKGLSSNKEAFFDLKLPRRRLLVQFTCNECGERTERLINPVAYERGTVFVQCAGCLVRHKLVDNLGLVVEYDLRDEVDSQNIDAK